MRILHLIYDHINNPWVGGGGAVRVYEIYKRLAGRHNIVIVCGNYPDARGYRKEGLDFHFVGTCKNNYVLSTFSYAIAAARFLYNHCKDADIVIEDFAPYNPVFSFLWRKNVVIQLHQKEGFQHIRKYFIFGIPFLFTEILYPKLFRNVITISELSKEKFGLKGHVTIVSNGFDSDLLKEETLEHDYILFLGRLHINQKGLDTLLEALKYINAKFLIAGGGKEYISSGMVEMVGFVSGQKKTELLRNCKFMIMPSRYEGQPIMLMEAAACRKSVVVSDIAELRYAVDAGFGLSFKTGDAKDMENKINFLIKNDSVRKEMGHKAREFAKNYTWDRIAEEYERFLIKVMEEE